jgi:phosphoglycerate dehydrogenase-like enzyme
MSPETLLVIADPNAKYLGLLRQISKTVRIIVSNQTEELQEACPAADCILFAAPNLADTLRAIFPHATRLRWVHTLNTGVEPILFPDLVASDVVLTNARGVYKHSLAEFVMAGVLFFTKDIERLLRNQELNVWQQFDSEEVRGKVMGIVGYGETGRRCAELGQAFGMKVLGSRRHPELSRDDPLLEEVFAPGELRKMLGRCDYVVISAAATLETRRLIGEPEIGSMKSHAVVINVGRGSLIDEPALIRALQQGSVRGAALDVFEVEPLPVGHPFYRMKNVLLSPHATDHTPGWRERAVQDFIQNFEKFMKGQPMRNIVDKRAGY